MAEEETKIINEGRRGFLARSSALPAGVLALPSLVGCGDGVISNAHAENSASAGGATSNASYTIDKSIKSPNQDSRVRTLVLHYTAQTLADSLASLTDQNKQVSAHYLVPDAPDNGRRFKVFELVPEACRAWHAGLSYWQGDRMLNAGSVGIEIVNLGFPPEDETLPLMNRRWYPYPDAQVAVFGRLAADVVARHQILPHKVVGHSDVAPGRKTDPGPLFPWKRLYDEFRIGAWPQAEAVAYYRSSRPFAGDIASLQSKLLAYGYDTPQTGLLDAQTVNVVSAFQMHFRPSRYDGVPDVETVAILDALLEKYFNRPRSLSINRQLLPSVPTGEKGGDVWPLPAAPR
ncbi:N-acetylmuramoyl-L-alanine amidase [Burkholderia singularis]|uniref:N-acetylmuramoyl-L-alanine amidase n=1 Tax=Burkholderia singularis TaxID=1503053 RepID=A0A238H2F2_9BURK|nr:N-acetylmuramoyl-L-alanine amidase [Burkholderia singularis]SMF99402.1 N-acetylmuramoyl-L-alanine amidase [Burkholderia singularis]